MALVSYREYARQKGVSLEAIRKRIKAGSITQRCIIRTPGVKWPKIDTVKADEDFAMLKDDANHFGYLLRAGALPKVEPTETLDPVDEMFEPTPRQQVDVKQKSILEKKHPPIDKPTTKVVDIDGKKVEVHVEPSVSPESHAYFNQYRKAKAGTEGLKARMLELEVGEMEGRLLDKEDVRHTIEKLVSLTREKLLNLPSKISPDLVAIKDLVQMENYLLNQINTALEDLQKLGGKFE